MDGSDAARACSPFAAGQVPDTDLVPDPDGVRERVNDALASFLAEKLAAARDPTARTLLEPVAALVLAPAKRVRATLCHWSWRAAGRDDSVAVLPAVCALELLHAGALIHDDVMDDSATRRGMSSVHEQFAQAHSRHRWRGGSADFGDAAAIVAGDLCLVWADELMRRSRLPAKTMRRANRVYDAMREETVHGQYLDLVAQARFRATPRESWQVALQKTAANTTTGPIALGGALSGSPESVRSALAAYARPLGVAFQLRDDLLGAFGRTAVTGKPSGDDLRAGKATMLLAMTRRLGGATATNRIDQLLARPEDRAVHELRQIITETGARAHVERIIGRLCARALAALDGAPPLGPAGAVFEQFAVAVASCGTGY